MNMTEYTTLFKDMGYSAQKASFVMAKATTERKNKALYHMSEILLENSAEVLAANEKDLSMATENGVRPVMIDRLRLTVERIEDMAEGLRQVAELPDPVNQLLETIHRPNGLRIEKRSVPMGVILIIYEARPNVTVDAAGLCFKTSNAVILRGGKEAFETNNVLVKLLQRGAVETGLPKKSIQLVTVTDREAVPVLLQQRKYIDVVIPRGSAGLIQRVLEESSIPVIETGSGIVHTYIDDGADLDKAIPIIINAKTQRPSVCNSLETLLIHKNMLDFVMPKLFNTLKEQNVEMRGDKNVCAAASKNGFKLGLATEQDWQTEYNDLILSIKMVASLDEAIEHINMYGTKHSECIITENEEHARQFMRDVDAAAVYVNASTRFTDGFEFGFGAEIGISTQKLHARGPMGLPALTSYKYYIFGDGQIRQ